MLGDSREVLIVGAGAIGRVIGGGLARAGSSVVFLDSDAELVARIEAEGVVVDRAGAETVADADAVTDLAGRSPVGTVLFCVKSYATAQAAETVALVVDRETTIASLQNGWGNGDVLAERFDPGQVVVGVTYNSATVANGKVVHSGSGETLVGPYVGDDEGRSQQLAVLLGGAGFASRSVPAVRQEIWRKLILNAATLPTAALTGLAAGQLAANEPMLALIDDVTREAVSVARALGYEIDLDERIAFIHEVLPKVGAGKASMLQDIENLRRTEIDVISGAVVRAAAETGVPVPLHKALFALVRGLEHSKTLV